MKKLRRALANSAIPGCGIIERVDHAHAADVVSVASAVRGLGTVFATFDDRTQDSGHVSYGVVRFDGHRRFVKTAGSGAVSPGGASHRERVEALRKAAQMQSEVNHPALVPIEEVLEATDGIVVVQHWCDGELLYSPRESRDLATEAGSRFRALPRQDIVGALDEVIDLHVALEAAGWVSGDLYDGNLMYDFGQRRIKVIDFEFYRRGPYLNEVGRLPGSTRFMAPEELVSGLMVDSRTTVYNLARLVDHFLTGQHPDRPLEALLATATHEDPGRRPPTVAALQLAWRAALGC